MNALFLIALAGCGQKDRVVGFSDYVKAHPRLEVKFDVVSNGVKGTGTFWIDGRRAQKLEASWGKWKFAFLQNPAGSFEIERTTKTYAEFGPIPYLFAPESRISDLPSYAYPLPFVTGDLQNIWPGTVKYAKKEEATIGGVGTEHLVGEHTGPVNIKTEAWIADDGRLIRYHYELRTSGGTITSTFNFKDYRSIPASERAFELDVPDGYLPDSLPHESEPIQPGALLPTELKESGATLFVLVEKGSKLCRLAVDAIKSPLNPVEVEASEALLAKTSTPGLPFFILSDGKGKVARVWFGFDPANSNAFIAEVKKAKG